MKSTTLAILIIAALALAASCDKMIEKAAETGAEKIVEASSGGDVDLDTKDGSVSYTDKDGNKVDIGSGSELPDGWPASLPVYPGSKILASSTAEIDKGTTMSVTMNSSDSKDEVVTFYTEKAKAAGYKKQSGYNTDDGGTSIWVKEGSMFSFTVGQDSKATHITLQTAPYDGEIPEQATEVETAAGGDLPDGFPESVVPIYAGAKVNMATQSGKNSMLSLTTADDIDSVADFYSAHWTGRGWTEKSSTSMADEARMKTFESSGGVIALTVTRSKDKGETAASITYEAK